MTPATLSGYKRSPAEAGDSFESIPKIVRTGSSNDVVHSMLIVGMHLSHGARFCKYQWKHEMGAFTPVEVELTDVEKMEAKASVRVYQDDYVEELVPYSGE